MGVQDLLLITFQMLIFGGVGGVFIVSYATRDIFLKEEAPQVIAPRFASAYEELMWLAEKQKKHPNSEEMRRFFQLRHSWSEMHSHTAGRHLR